MKSKLSQLVYACLNNSIFYGNGKESIEYTGQKYLCSNNIYIKDITNEKTNFSMMYLPLRKNILDEFYKIKPDGKYEYKVQSGIVIGCIGLKIKFDTDPEINISVINETTCKRNEELLIKIVKPRRLLPFLETKKSYKVNYDEYINTYKYVISSGIISEEITEEEFNNIIKLYKDSLERLSIEADTKKIEERLIQYQ